MGSSQSKQSSKDGKRNGRSNTTSPNQEKHNSADSKTPLTSHATGLSAPRSPSPNQQHTIAANSSPKANANNQHTDGIEVDEQEGHSNVTRPPPPPRLRRLSELIDPHELTIDSHIRSPSGNLLAVEQFLVHPDRPRSMRERQEQIREKVRAASRLGQTLENVESEEPRARPKQTEKTKGKLRWFLCGCFGGS
jgi:hypothetical protein